MHRYASHTIPILSLVLFIPSLYYLFLNLKNFSFTRSNGGLAPKIGLVLGQSWMVMCKCISPVFIEYAVVYM